MVLVESRLRFPGITRKDGGTTSHRFISKSQIIFGVLIMCINVGGWICVVYSMQKPDEPLLLFAGSSGSALNPDPAATTMTTIATTCTAMTSPVYPTMAFPMVHSQAFESVEESIVSLEQIKEYRRRHGIAEERQLIYFITPTHRTLTQMVDLVRLSQTLMHDNTIVWVVVEDELTCTQRVRSLLERTCLMFVHLHELTPPGLKRLGAQKKAPRGVNQRNRALKVVESLSNVFPGVIYFGDVDNAYDIRLFEELRKTPKYSVGIFAVAFTGPNGHYERCKVNEKTGKVEDFLSNVKNGRKFPVDMAQFCFHSSLLVSKKPRFSNKWKIGYLETEFLAQVIKSFDEFVPLADNCTSIYAWHVSTSANKENKANKVHSDPYYEIIGSLV